MELNRRDFLALSTGAAAASALPMHLTAQAAAAASIPWHQKIRRAGQINITEHDPAVMNVEAWADYWASLKVDVVFASVTGIIAYFPSETPFHRRSKFLNGRDFTGELVAAAKKRNLRVIGRFSPDLNWGDALEAHPEWFQRNKDGSPKEADEEPLLFRTCIFSTYMTEHMPALMREVNKRYAVDGLFTNAWPELERLPECYCVNCKDLPHYDTPAYWDIYTQRVVMLWKMWDAIAKEKGPDNLFFGNMGGGIKGGPELMPLRGLVQWFNCDNQGRGGEEEPIWGCTLQGRVCNAITEGHTATNVTASYCTGKPRWRNIHKSTEEAQMWMNETVASGMVPWYHFIGAEEGLGADRRWHQPGFDYFNWLAKHDDHLTNKTTIAEIAVVMGQRNQRFYQHADLGNPMMSVNGLYLALLEGRFLFDFLHEQDLLHPAKLKKYKTLLLPNVAILTDEECEGIRRFVKNGGSVMASFETSLYDENNKRRSDFGLADVLGVHAAGERRTRVGNAYMGRIERKHPILDGFADTDWLPGAQFLQPTAPVKDPVLTVIPPFVNYPPELAYPYVEKTDIPNLVATENGSSRIVYYAGDIERTAWQSGNKDLSRILQNAIRWLTRDSAPVTVTGSGFVETFAWQTKAGYAIHVLNYTNPAAFKGYMRDFYPIGEQHVTMVVPAGERIKRVAMLRAGKDVPFQQSGGKVTFTMPGVVDLEIAGLYTS